MVDLPTVPALFGSTYLSVYKLTKAFPPDIIHILPKAPPFSLAKLGFAVALHRLFFKFTHCSGCERTLSNALQAMPLAPSHFWSAIHVSIRLPTLAKLRLEVGLDIIIVIPDCEILLG